MPRRVAVLLIGPFIQIDIGPILDPNAEQLKKSLILLALPREAREVSNFNNLSKSLGREGLIAFQYVSASPPKLLQARAR
jgi:hypothetical protein